jgi:transposase-like protein
MIPIGKFKSIIQLLDHFKDETYCKQHLAQQRWGGKPRCPHCGYDTKIYTTTHGYKCANSTCYKKFSVTVGTAMENSKISLRYWFAAIHILTSYKRGMSSYQLAGELGITQKSAWHLSHRIRSMYGQNNPDKIEIVAAADESFVGGKNKNRHKDKKVKNSQGRSYKDKTPVLGLMEIGKLNKIRTFVIPNTNSDVLQPLIESNIEQGTLLMTDEWSGYNQAHTHCDHKFVRHGQGQYVDGNITTNSVENFWSHLKRGIIGVYYHVSRKHLQRYCDEFTYRFNTRDLSNFDRFQDILTKVNRRLSWKDLVLGN